MMASQKLGMLIPKSPKVVPRLSSQELGREPAHTPRRDGETSCDDNSENRQLKSRGQA